MGLRTAVHRGVLLERAHVQLAEQLVAERRANDDLRRLLDPAPAGGLEAAASGRDGKTQLVSWVATIWRRARRTGVPAVAALGAWMAGAALTLACVAALGPSDLPPLAIRATPLVTTPEVVPPPRAAEPPASDVEVRAVSSAIRLGRCGANGAFVVRIYPDADGAILGVRVDPEVPGRFGVARCLERAAARLEGLRLRPPGPVPWPSVSFVIDLDER